MPLPIYDMYHNQTIPNADALLWRGFLIRLGGEAIAQVIYKEVNPTGRLPYTIVCNP